ncbi:ergosterol biosynthetic protein 28 homolog isoform X2 [Erinaceus europaeus]|uniref:Ergosterol biosynthetic protein 28 homolog isoform X2 n=1 Tax=Erinaceus europaeus TaxID=9365 RepID=A0ABM3WL39_ERIEU|nr:ergosterol biosynthetic protein 28 homolog isoform X2 [Erinaceus europaeus]
MSRFLNVLRSWLVMVSVIAMGNTLQSFWDHTFLHEKLYTGKPDLVNGLQARTFGIWTLLSSVIRCLCAIDIHNKMTEQVFSSSDPGGISLVGLRRLTCGLYRPPCESSPPPRTAALLPRTVLVERRLVAL